MAQAQDGAELESLRATVRAAIRDVPDFPRPGILFRDITPALADGAILRAALELQLAAVERLGRPDTIVGVESRGFLFGMALASRLEVGFAPVRKPGKLPAATLSEHYDLEYGSSELHIHVDALGPKARVIVVDDLLATGGTAAASCRLVERLGAQVLGCVFLVELVGLKGRAKLEPHRVESVLTF